MKKTAVEWYAEQAMRLELERAKGIISINQMLNQLSNVLDQAKGMEKKEKLTRQLFIGKVVEIIGFEKTLELLKESEKTINQ